MCVNAGAKVVKECGPCGEWLARDTRLLYRMGMVEEPPAEKAWVEAPQALARQTVSLGGSLGVGCVADRISRVQGKSRACVRDCVA